MKNNPWYDESLPYGHVDPNAHLRALETRWYQQQEDQRLFDLNQQAHGGDFTRLQAVSNQTAYQHGYGHHHGNGVQLGGIAAGAAAGYYLANRAQRDFTPQYQVVHPAGWRPSYLWVFLVSAAVLHFFFGVHYLVADQASSFWTFGSVFWVPAWILGIWHQIRVSDHNRGLEKQQN